MELILLVVLGSLLLLMVAMSFVALVLRRRLAPAEPRGTHAMDELRSLGRAGRNVEAIHLYRRLARQGLDEANGAVEQPGGRAPAAVRKQGILLREVRDSDIELQIRTGYLVDAIALYREKNGVGLQEARTAVERWRDRLRAS
jgi:ribosomal protein L7/L12